jgi:pimeloyl-ACP methyl ester carboxylesterase
MPHLSSPELRTNYQMIGPALREDRTPIALIHGLGANLAFWYLGAAPQLGADRSILMHDLRGHGASSMPSSGYDLDQLAEDFRTLLDGLNIPRAHVVGHSHGARVALAFALAHPDRTASLTVADTQLRALQPPMRLRDWPYWPRWKAELLSQGVTTFPSEESEIDFRVLADLGPRGRQAISATGAADLPAPAEDADDDRPLARFLRGRQTDLAARMPDRPGARLADRLAARLPARAGDDGPPRGGIDLRNRQMGGRGARQWQKLLADTTAGRQFDDESAVPPEALPQLQMPTLLMYGEFSHCTPTSERLLETLPDARRIIVPEAGHFFPLVKPRAFARALRMFVSGVEAADTPARQHFIARVMAARGGRLRRMGGGA